MLMIMNFDPPIFVTSQSEVLHESVAHMKRQPLPIPKLQAEG